MKTKSLKGYTVDSVHSCLDKAIQRKDQYIVMCGCNVELVESINGYGWRLIVPCWAYMRMTGSTAIYAV